MRRLIGLDKQGLKREIIILLAQPCLSTTLSLQNNLIMERMVLSDKTKSDTEKIMMSDSNFHAHYAVPCSEMSHRQLVNTIYSLGIDCRYYNISKITYYTIAGACHYIIYVGETVTHM